MTTIISGNTPSTIGNDTTINGDITAANLPTQGSIVGYQQGLWIPTCSSGTCGPDIGPHYWWRIGNAVTVKGNIKNFSDLTSSSVVEILGLPYPLDLTFTGFYNTARLNQIDYTSGAATICYLTSNGGVSFSIQTPNTGSLSLKHSALNTTNSAIAFTMNLLTDDTTWTPINGATVS